MLQASARCAYSGLCYCADCMGHETCMLPAMVVHNWDFSKYPVSQLAADFLLATFSQPVISNKFMNSGRLHNNFTERVVA